MGVQWLLAGQPVARHDEGLNGQRPYASAAQSGARHLLTVPSAAPGKQRRLSSNRPESSARGARTARFVQRAPRPVAHPTGQKSVGPGRHRASLQEYSVGTRLYLRTCLVSARDGSRKGRYPNTQFEFLGYTFRPRVVKNRKRHSVFVSFTPAVSSAAQKAMRQTTRRRNFRNRSDLSLEDIAQYYNPVLRGWLRITGGMLRRRCIRCCRHFNQTLIAWAMRKYRRLKGHKSAGKPLHGGYREAAATSVCTLATRDGWRVCLMGAV